MRKRLDIIRGTLSWIICAIGVFDFLLTYITSQAREDALTKLIADTHLPVDSPEIGAAIAHCNAGLASFSGYHFFVSFAVLLVGLLLVATSYVGTSISSRS